MTINKQALRERYSEKPAPKCHICGAVMTIQRAGSGGVVYGCTGRIDKDGEGYKFETGRDFADDHYARSRVTDYSPSGDPDVLALLDELEAAEKRVSEVMGYNVDLAEESRQYQHKIAELDNALCELLPGIQYMDPPDGGSVTPLEQVRRMVADYRQRIAELEAREVELPEPFKMAKSSSGLTYYYEDEVNNAIRAAGISIKGE